MLELSRIPSDHYKPAKELMLMGMGYCELKSASLTGGVLVRWRSEKTKRVYYKSKNLRLL